MMSDTNDPTKPLSEYDLDTFLSHAGCQGHRYPEPSHSHLPPVFMSVNFGVDDLRQAKLAGSRTQPGYCYARLAEPTGDVLRHFLCELEGGDDALLFGSGMAAISSAILSVMESGDNLLVARAIYSGTASFVEKVLPRLGMTITYFDPRLPALHLDEIKTDKTRAVFCEPLANPLCHVCDMADYGNYCQQNGLKLLVDNTLTPPPLCCPLEQGAWLSIHSLTKYINGHGDVLSGAVIGSKEAVQAVYPLLLSFGGNLSPWGTYLIMRGARTLALRYKAAAKNALKLAKWMENESPAKEVYHPGLPSHPQHDLAVKQFGTAEMGGVFSFLHPGDDEAVDRFIQALQLVSFAPSLGEPNSLVEYPLANQYGAASRKEKRERGIVEGLVRLAIGLESTDDLIADVKQAFAKST
jgi:methionine-gamma-lyase